MLVALDEMKQYLRVDFDEDDSLLEHLIAAGESLCMDIVRIDDAEKFAKEKNARIAVMYAGEILEEALAETILNDPQHPYTQGFIRSLPSRGLHPISGSSPSLIDPPSGCRFHPRCPYAMEVCKSEHPQMMRLENGHSSRCFLCG